MCDKRVASTALLLGHLLVPNWFYRKSLRLRSLITILIDDLKKKAIAVERVLTAEELPPASSYGHAMRVTCCCPKYLIIYDSPAFLYWLLHVKHFKVIYHYFSVSQSEFDGHVGRVQSLIMFFLHLLVKVFLNIRYRCFSPYRSLVTYIFNVVSNTRIFNYEKKST